MLRGEQGAVLEGELGAGVRIDKPMYDIMCVCVCEAVDGVHRVWLQLCRKAFLRVVFSRQLNTIAMRDCVYR